MTTTKSRRTAADLMHRKVETVRPNMLVGELARLLDSKRISGVPVVDRGGRLVGVVSKSDLVHHETEGADVYESESRPLPKGFHSEMPDRTTVADIMTPAVVEAPPEASVGRLARLMRRRRIHRVFITKGQKLLGVVATMDLLKLLEEEG
ncbi:MAG: CBS domain-containing protein [Elusimicrobia bacterium]|nr:CBS domain-containing protein [Elusimicrobiota bacterium]